VSPPTPPDSGYSPSEFSQLSEAVGDLREELGRLRHDLNNLRTVVNALSDEIDSILKKLPPRISEAESPATTVGKVGGSIPPAGSSLTTPYGKLD
jgi:ABC-type transporter Mla subunit MlaD